MAARDMAAWKIFRISRLFKLTLIVVVFTGLCLFLMVHQIELPLPMTYGPGDDLQQFGDNVQEVREREEISNILQNNDALVRDLLNFHTNLSVQNTSTSHGQPQYQLKSRLNSLRHSSKRVANETGIKLSRFEHRRLPNYSRGFSDDNRQLPEIQSDSQRRSDTTKSSRQITAEGNRFEQTLSQSEIGTNVELQSNLNAPKVNFEEPE